MYVLDNGVIDEHKSSTRHTKACKFPPLALANMTELFSASALVFADICSEDESAVFTERHVSAGHCVVNMLQRVLKSLQLESRRSKVPHRKRR